jgi:Zn finger protein HypA/HybF involved in hydrogenase expression
MKNTKNTHKDIHLEKDTQIKTQDIDAPDVESEKLESEKQNEMQKLKEQDLADGTEQVLVDPEVIVICKHCGKQVDQSSLIGLSLKCPLCGKPQNGHPKDPMMDPYQDMTVICKHCGQAINQVLLRGISLICPLCGKPQNGMPHPKHVK